MHSFHSQLSFTTTPLPSPNLLSHHYHHHRHLKLTATKPNIIPCSSRSSTFLSSTSLLLPQHPKQQQAPTPTPTTTPTPTPKRSGPCVVMQSLDPIPPSDAQGGRWGKVGDEVFAANEMASQSRRSRGRGGRRFGRGRGGNRRGGWQSRNRGMVGMGYDTGSGRVDNFRNSFYNKFPGTSVEAEGILAVWRTKVVQMVGILVQNEEPMMFGDAYKQALELELVNSKEAFRALIKFLKVELYVRIEPVPFEKIPSQLLTDRVFQIVVRPKGFHLVGRRGYDDGLPLSKAVLTVDDWDCPVNAWGTDWNDLKRSKHLEYQQVTTDGASLISIGEDGGEGVSEEPIPALDLNRPTIAAADPSEFGLMDFDEIDTRKADTVSARGLVIRGSDSVATQVVYAEDTDEEEERLAREAEEERVRLEKLELDDIDETDEKQLQDALPKVPEMDQNLVSALSLDDPERERLPDEYSPEDFFGGPSRSYSQLQYAYKEGKDDEDDSDDDESEDQDKSSTTQTAYGAPSGFDLLRQQRKSASKKVEDSDSEVDEDDDYMLNLSSDEDEDQVVRGEKPWRQPKEVEEDLAEVDSDGDSDTEYKARVASTDSDEDDSEEEEKQGDSDLEIAELKPLKNEETEEQEQVAGPAAKSPARMEYEQYVKDNIQAELDIEGDFSADEMQDYLGLDGSVPDDDFYSAPSDERMKQKRFTKMFEVWDPEKQGMEKTAKNEIFKI